MQGIIELVIVMFTLSAEIAIVYFALGLIWKAIMTVITLIAVRCFGWRPIIFNRSLAEFSRDECMRRFGKLYGDLISEHTAQMDELNRKAWESIVKQYSVAIIECYTLLYHANKAKPDKVQREEVALKKIAG